MEGTVVDPTWKDAAEHLYFGVPFNRDFLAALFKRSRGVCGLLSNCTLMRRYYGTSELFQVEIGAVTQFSGHAETALEAV